MDEGKLEIDCLGCNGDGFTVPYGPNGYEAQETCSMCDGSKKIAIDKQCCCCKKDLNDGAEYELDDLGIPWCIPCYLTESDIGEETQ